ncbi:hypothetical protein [Streptomyces sp. H39-C1]|uniref:hypothetical protein n=1 Tax=Streptomyces sp. H39-C1 TaxID=3004355 RepID=UPI0022AFD72A|nr:hypothetical protein [Streptomyces sp. H39-C1]MCZ4095314.1 hypothetical protein [Streptomyces sp. H39-C1]
MPTEDNRPDIIPSEVDPDVECVRIDDAGDLAEPPEAPVPADAQEPKLCPDGYLPRRRSRGDQPLAGKRVITDEPPIRNPDDPATY